MLFSFAEWNNKHENDLTMYKWGKHQRLILQHPRVNKISAKALVQEQVVQLYSWISWTVKTWVGDDEWKCWLECQKQLLYRVVNIISEYLMFLSLLRSALMYCQFYVLILICLTIARHVAEKGPASRHRCRGLTPTSPFVLTSNIDSGVCLKFGTSPFLYSSQPPNIDAPRPPGLKGMLDLH